MRSLSSMCEYKEIGTSQQDKLCSCWSYFQEESPPPIREHQLLRFSQPPRPTKRTPLFLPVLRSKKHKPPTSSTDRQKMSSSQQQVKPWDSRFQNPAVPHTNSYYFKCMIAGVLSCGVTHTLICPLDVVKCNMQVR